MNRKRKSARIKPTTVAAYFPWPHGIAAGAIFFLMILCMLSIPARAENIAPADRGVSADEKFENSADLDTLIRHAFENNPEISAARENWRAVVEKYRVATGYPDPQLMVTYFPEPIETRLGPQDWNASLTQMIPFPGKLSQAGKVVEAEAEAARLNLDKTVRDTILGVRESFHELEYIRKARQVAGNNAKLLDHLRKISETALADERATLMDVVKAQSQVGQLRYDMILLEELEQTEIARLNGLLDRPPDSGIGKLSERFPEKVTLDLNTMYQMAQTRQEEILIAEAWKKMAEAKLDLARFDYLPELKFGVVYSSIGEPDVHTPPEDAGRDALGIQAGISIPLWFGKNSARVGQARAELQKSRSIEKARINNAKTQIRAAYFKVQNAWRLMELYKKELIPQAAKSMETAETWFSENEASFGDFIETQAVWYNFQLAYARARADYGKALAKLERLVGQRVTGDHDSSAETREVP